MNLSTRLGALPLLALLAIPCLAQEPPQTPPPAASEPATASQPPAAPAPSPATTTTVPAQKRPPVDPKIIEDGGLSIEPIYWLNRQQPMLKTGATSIAVGDLDYGSAKAKYSLGGELSIPAGRANTLRFSYFRVQGNGTATPTVAQNIFGQAYDAGDYLAGGYLLQSAKISWDYLSYTWYKPSTKIRFKTLYELQYVNIGTTIAAPFKAQSVDSSGNLLDNVAAGSKSLILPSLGAEFEGELGKHVRWEVKGSGFGLHHKANVWDAQGSIAVRLIDNVEIIAGERAFHFKTSPAGDQYFQDTLEGAFVGVRYYWGSRQ